MFLINVVIAAGRHVAADSRHALESSFQEKPWRQGFASKFSSDPVDKESISFTMSKCSTVLFAARENKPNVNKKITSLPEGFNTIQVKK